MARPIKHTRYFADVSFGGKLAPTLSKVKRRLKDRTALHEALADDAATRTRRWIRDAASTRHETANALGASPTQYLSKRAAAVEARHDAKAAGVVIKGAIFARVLRDVVIVPKRARMLTIPVHRDSYGKRAGDFGKLVAKKAKDGKATFLCRRKGGRLEALFMLVKSSVLPRDAGLLPSDKHYAKWAEAVAREWLKNVQRSTLNVQR